jgi:hypothetical protein
MADPDPWRDPLRSARWLLKAGLWMVGFFLTVSALCVLVLPEHRPGSDYGELTLHPDPHGSIPFRHRWTNEALRMREWKGNRPRIDWRLKLTPMEVASVLDLGRLDHMANTFGLPEEWVEGADVAADYRLRRTRQQLAGRAARRGVTIRFEDDGIVILPDYDWIIENSEEDVRDLARQIQHIAAADGSQRKLYRVAASFVQSFDYRIPREIRKNRGGERVNNLGIATPIEVLYHKWGDCDSKSLLFASILSHFAGQRLIFLRGQDHLFVGVRGIPRLGDHFVEFLGVRYVLIEMTSPWPIGRIPIEMWSGLRRNQFMVIALGGEPRRDLWFRGRRIRFPGSILPRFSS